jgi:hypothetical protein
MALANDRPIDAERVYGQFFWPGLTNAGINALIAFLLVNLAGFLFLGLRRVFRWVSTGYR